MLKVDLDEVIDTIERVSWYHIGDDGKLVKGANSALHTPLFKAEDIFRALESFREAEDGK